MSHAEFWTPERIALLGTDSDVAIAQRLGVSLGSVWRQRTSLSILRIGHPSGEKQNWDCLCTYKDEEVAKLTGRKLSEVVAKRRSL